jgi:hypothetical protein
MDIGLGLDLGKSYMIIGDANRTLGSEVETRGDVLMFEHFWTSFFSSLEASGRLTIFPPETLIFEKVP